MLRLGARYLHTPRGLKQVPLPRQVMKTGDIQKHIDVAEAVQSQTEKQLPKHVQSLFPQHIEPDALVSKSLNGEKVWYSVSRTHMGNLPVYTDYNNAGGVWTEVRKIQGNVSALRSDLQTQLGLGKKEIWIQDTSKRIIIKGNRSREVKALLGEQF